MEHQIARRWRRDTVLSNEGLRDDVIKGVYTPSHEDGTTPCKTFKNPCKTHSGDGKVTQKIETLTPKMTYLERNIEQYASKSMNELLEDYQVRTTLLLNKFQRLLLMQARRLLLTIPGVSTMYY